MSQVQAGLKYTKEHEWVRVEGNLAVVGITDHAQSSLGDIVFLELPKEGKVFKQMDVFGQVESVKAASDLYAPLSGSVQESNRTLADNPEAINKDPYGEGWLLKVKIENLSELNNLLDAPAYEAYLKSL